LASTPTLVSGVKATGNFVSGREDTDYQRDIFMLDRWKNPLTLMASQLSTKTVQTIDYHWWEDQYFPYTDQINDDGGIAEGVTTWTVDDASKFRVGDLARVPRINEVALVTAVNETSNELTVVREAGVGEGWTSTKAALVDNDYIEILGPAFEQGHAMPTIRTVKVEDRKNYCQDMRKGLGMSEIAIATALRTGGSDWKHQLDKMLVEHKEDIEKVNIYGKPYAGDKGIYVSGTGNANPAQAGGIDHFLATYAATANKVDQDELTMFEFLDFLEVGFDKGSREKYLWCTPSFGTALAKWGITKMNTFAGDKLLGMDIQKWVYSGNQVVYFMMHDMLKSLDPGTIYWNNYLLDMNYLSWVFFEGNAEIPSGRTRLRDVVVSDGATMKKKEWQTIQSIQVELPDHHARLRNKSFATT